MSGEDNYDDNDDDVLEESEEEEGAIDQDEIDDPMDIDTTEIVDANLPQSTFEKKQMKMNVIIEKLEEEAVKDKHWVLKGEASNKNRPLNSLLEEDLEVDFTKRPAPIITEETTDRKSVV